MSRLIDRLSLAAAVLLGFVGCAAAQMDLRVDVSRDALDETLDLFATLDRISGGEDERRANAYLRDKLSDYGVPFESYDLSLYLSHPISAGVEVLGPGGGKLDAINHAFSRSTPAGGVEGELIYIGYDMQEDPFDAPLIDYGATDVSGKIVLDDGYPAPYRAWATEEAGAIAQIFINPDNQLHNMTVTTIWGSPTPETEQRIPDNPIVAVRRPDGDALRARLAAGENIRVRITGEVDTRWRETELVVAEIRGTTEADKFVLVGGHLDSWHEGVTDNATANAAMLEMARILNDNRDRLRRSVRIAWWPGHSPGRYAGATWYADNFYNDLRQNAVAYINMDSIGIRSGTLYRATAMAELEPYVRGLIFAMTGQELDRVGRIGKTADEAFSGIGVSSVRASKAIPAGSDDRGTADGSGGAWWWHARSDSRDKADTDLLMKDTDVFVAMVEGLTAPPTLPFNYYETAKEMLGELEQIDGPEAARLAERVRLLRARALKLNGLGIDDVRDPAAYNDALLRIGRALNSAYYTRSGPYDHDSDELIPRFPGLTYTKDDPALDDEQRRFLAVRRQREANRIEEGLLTAIAIADGLLMR